MQKTMCITKDEAKSLHDIWDRGLDMPQEYEGRFCTARTFAMIVGKSYSTGRRWLSGGWKTQEFNNPLADSAVKAPGDPLRSPNIVPVHLVFYYRAEIKATKPGIGSRDSFWKKK